MARARRSTTTVTRGVAGLALLVAGATLLALFADGGAAGAAGRHTGNHRSALRLVALTKTAKARPTKTVSPSPSPSSSTTTTAPAAQPRTWGVTMPGLPTDTTGLDQLDGELGATPGVVMWYQAWSTGTGFPTAAATAIADRGATPEITWEPWDPAAGVSQPAYTLASIASGAHDAYISAWAQAIAAWGRPLQLRFAHEMNGNWYPWDEGVNGNAAGSYVAAWDHVQAVFAAAGATHVTWIWSPNVPYTGSTPLSELYPGDARVGEVALDGYNWSTLQSWSSWTSFADVFGAGISQLAAISTRPVAIGEVGCPEVGGDKAAWMSGMWATLSSWPQVRSLMWFDFDKETDWRIDSSTTAAAAFAQGIPAYLAG